MRQSWTQSLTTRSTVYCDGELYDAQMNGLQPTPLHCVWLTGHDSRNRTDLLLDTEMGRRSPMPTQVDEMRPRGRLVVVESGSWVGRRTGLWPAF